jgi:hypothetical protein
MDAIDAALRTPNGRLTGPTAPAQRSVYARRGVQALPNRQIPHLPTT